MKRLTTLLFVLTIAGCMSKYQHIDGYNNIQKYAKEMCEAGCLVGLNVKDIKAADTYSNVRKCFDSCVELSYADINKRKLKDKCCCDLE